MLQFRKWGLNRSNLGTEQSELQTHFRRECPTFDPHMGPFWERDQPLNLTATCHMIVPGASDFLAVGII